MMCAFVSHIARGSRGSFTTSARSVRSVDVNGQQEFLVGGQDFSLPADSSCPRGRTAVVHFDESVRDGDEPVSEQLGERDGLKAVGT
jgi:hypothetical protein